MNNLVSSFNDMKLYGGATISSGRLICNNNGDYASLRIQADPLSEITVRCLCKATGTPDMAGVSIAYPSTTTQITSVAGKINDWHELELKFTVPMDSNNSGYVEIRFGSTSTGTAWFTKPVIQVKKSSRFAGGIIAGAAVIVSGGTASFSSSICKFGFESVAIDASMMWINVTLTNRYYAAGSALLPVISATLDPNSGTNVTKIVAGNFGGDGNSTFRVNAIDASGNAINLSTASIRFFVSAFGF